MSKSKIKRRIPKVILPKKQPVYSHYTAPYLLAPEHPITVKVIGCGGSGSQVLANLARMNVSLLALGHPGLAVQAWDPDKVTEANLGRQLFSISDLDQYKCKVIIERINRFYGFAWSANPMKFDQTWVKSRSAANIMITCVDNVDTRLMVQSEMTKLVHSYERNPFSIPYYWLDLGNNRTTGQVVLGTFGHIRQPKRTQHTVKKLPTIIDMVPDMKRHEQLDQAPSCSLAEALGKQDLFINSTLAQYGCDLIWKLFQSVKIQFHGAYINLDTFQTNPIIIKPTQ